MTVIKLSDIGQLQVNVSSYILQKSIETNAFLESGVISRAINAETQALLNAGGKTVIFPFFNDLSGSGQIMDESTNLTIGNVTTGLGVAPVLERAEVCGSTDLVVGFSGNDPMKLIGDRVSTF